MNTSRCDVFVHHKLQPGHNILVSVLTGNELPFVVPAAVVQQQFNMTGENSSGMCVYRMMQFLLNVPKATGDAFSLASGQVQGLLLPIVEESVVTYMAVQGCPVYEVRVEGQKSSFVRQCIVSGHAEYLTWLEKDHGRIVVVVVHPAAAAASSRALLNQQDGVEFKLDRLASQVGFLQVDKCGLGVQGLGAQGMLRSRRVCSR